MSTFFRAIAFRCIPCLTQNVSLEQTTMVIPHFLRSLSFPPQRSHADPETCRWSGDDWRKSSKSSIG